MQYSQFIAGEFRQGASAARFTVINPSNGQALGDYAHATKADVEEAINAATEAFRTWRKTSALERSALLRRAASLMRERGNAIAEQIARELGKPYGEAQKEVVTAAEMFEWASEEARRIYGRIIPARGEGITQTVVWEPVGPVAGRYLCKHRLPRLRCHAGSSNSFKRTHAINASELVEAVGARVQRQEHRPSCRLR